MRITKNQLKQIIKEELAGVLGEEDYPIPRGPKDSTKDDENIVDSLPLPADPELKPGEKKKPKDVGKPGYNPPKEKPPAIPMQESRRRKVRRTRKK